MSAARGLHCAHVPTEALALSTHREFVPTGAGLFAHVLDSFAFGADFLPGFRLVLLGFFLDSFVVFL